MDGNCGVDARGVFPVGKFEVVRSTDGNVGWDDLARCRDPANNGEGAGEGECAGDRLGDGPRGIGFKVETDKSIDDIDDDCCLE